MGSVGNQNPFAPYDNYRDCSQGICSIYCPQFCYLIFPPPPPSDDDSSAPFSPLIIAIIGVLASAFLLVSYYTIVTRYCKKRGYEGDGGAAENDDSRDESTQGQWHNSTGLDESLIKAITVCKYKKGDGLIEGTECAVCLSEFRENESLRLLPKCSHAFHVPCIDMWLKSQSNCPLCRANVVAVGPAQVSPLEVSVSPYEIRRPDDLVVVVDDPERNCGSGAVVGVGCEDDGAAGGAREEEVRRSVSLDAFSGNRRLLVSDILKFEEIEEYVQLESDQLWRGGGCSSNDLGLLRSPVAVKRSVSAGRFMHTGRDKGKNSLLPS